MFGAVSELGGRGWWRLLLTITPPLAAVALPWILVFAHGDESSDRARLVPAWADGRVDFGLVTMVVFVHVVFFVQTRRSPAAQRPQVVLSWAYSGVLLVYGVADALSVLAPSWAPSTAWRLVLTIAAAPAGGVVGWLLAGRTAESERVPAPEPGARPLYVRTAWASTLTAMACSMFAIGASLGAINGVWHTALFFGFALWFLVFARYRIRVDHRGVSLTLSLLGEVGHLVCFQEIVFAEVAPRLVVWAFPMSALSSRGYSTKLEPALVLHVLGGREFVVAAEDPQYVAAIVNHELRRQRSGVTTG